MDSVGLEMSNDRARYRYSEMLDFLIAVYTRLGLTDSDAEVVALRQLVGDLRGFETHGLERLPDYAKCLAEGRINPRPAIHIERATPCVVKVNGDNGMGHLVASHAMKAALDAAESVGIGVATMNRSNHIGAACAYSLLAVERGCIGIVKTNTSPAVAPWGSRRKLLGTNPISVSIPAGRSPPFVLDMATSAASRLTIRDAKEQNLCIPKNWAIDSAGNPTDDPEAALSGALLPFGGPKGSALTMLVDILAGVLSGAQFGGRVLSFFTNFEREADSGGFFLAMKIAAFMPLPEFCQRMDQWIEDIKALDCGPGCDSVRIPGERGHALQADRRRNGLPLRAGAVSKLRALARDLSLAFPHPSHSSGACLVD